MPSCCFGCWCDLGDTCLYVSSLKCYYCGVRTSLLTIILERNSVSLVLCSSMYLLVLLPFYNFLIVDHKLSQTTIIFGLLLSRQCHFVSVMCLSCAVRLIGCWVVVAVCVVRCVHFLCPVCDTYDREHFCFQGRSVFELRSLTFLTIMCFCPITPMVMHFQLSFVVYLLMLSVILLVYSEFETMKNNVVVACLKKSLIS